MPDTEATNGNRVRHFLCLFLLFALITGAAYQRRPVALLAIAAAGQAFFVVARPSGVVLKKAQFIDGSAAVLILHRYHR